MHAAVFVPGIMGTRLYLPDPNGGMSEEIWPPTVRETLSRYGRIDKLLDPRVVPGQIIDKVFCYSFYSTLIDYLEELGFTEGGQEKRRYEFPYDWRKNLFETAELLAARLDQAHADGAKTISLIGHSMGGLVLRIVLESELYKARPWFVNIKQFIALAVPHLGAPLALARIFGIDSALGIQGEDFVKLANDARYPSGYQLLPAPGEAACWNQASADLEPLDFYDSAVARRLGMTPELVTQAKALHDVIGAAGSAPTGVRYFYFGGAGHRTVTRVNVTARPNARVNHGSSIMTKTQDAGDGTVPLFSALPHLGQRQMVVNEHSTVFEGAPFRKVFYRLLGGDLGAALEATRTTSKTQIALSLEAPIVTVFRPVELVLSVSDPANAASVDDTELAARTDSLSGKLVVEKLVDGTGSAERTVHEIPIAYAGPPITHLRVDLEGIEATGHYRVKFEGNLEAANSPVFAVAEM